MNGLSYAEIAKMLDHSLLGPGLTDAELADGCRWAATADVASVCIKPYAVKLAADLLAGSQVRVGTVVGFPHGCVSTALKVTEAQIAMADGAVELDMVVNIGKVLSEDWAYVGTEIGAVVSAARDRNAIVKVIFENSMLQDEHKVRLCELCAAVGAHFVKTSTGYGDGGATDHDIKLMRTHSPPHVQVKAAGGIRTLDRLLSVRALGVTRVGATASKSILDELKARLGTVGCQ
jgi:deoxyribose-phosphate aldolase